MGHRATLAGRKHASIFNSALHEACALDRETVQLVRMSGADVLDGARCCTASLLARRSQPEVDYKHSFPLLKRCRRDGTPCCQTSALQADGGQLQHLPA